MGTIHPALIARDVPVFYATSEGQTRRIAVRLAGMLKERGISSMAIDINSSDADYVDWSRVRAAVVGASIHAGRHQRVATRFVRTHLAALNAVPSVFFSVSLAIASRKPEEAAAARKLAEDFPARLGWTPQEIACVAGALVYTKYGLLKRFLMRRIARAEGGPTDTSRDHELTDWEAVANLADRIATMARRGTVSAA